jgi:hypothetical protein
MANKRTDREVMEALAEWIIGLGIEESRHQKFNNNKEANFTENDNYLTVYYSGNDYVSLELIVDRVKLWKIHIINGITDINCSKLSNEMPMMQNVVDKVMSFDARTFSTLVRKELKFLVKGQKQRAMERKLEEIDKLKMDAKKLEAKIKGLEK